MSENINEVTTETTELSESLDNQSIPAAFDEVLPSSPQSLTEEQVVPAQEASVQEEMHETEAELPLLDDLKIRSVVMPIEVEPLNTAAIVPPPVVRPEPVAAPQAAPVPEQVIVKTANLAIYPSRFVFELVTLCVGYLGATKKPKLHKSKPASFSIPASDITMVVATRAKHNNVILKFVADNSPVFNAKGKIFALNRVEWTVTIAAAATAAVGNALKQVDVDLIISLGVNA